MKTDQASQVFDCLSSGVRLDIWRNLIKEGRKGKVAGELAKELDIAPSALSFHLKNMLYAQLVFVEQEGRFQRYRANIEMMNGLIAFLTEKCCDNEAESDCVLSNESQVCASIAEETGK